MAGENQSHRSVLTSPVSDGTAAMTEYDFYQLAELLSKSVTAAGKSAQESIRFSASAGIAFPTRDVAGVTRREDGSYEVKVAFLGLHGSQSPLRGITSTAWRGKKPSRPKVSPIFLICLITALSRCCTGSGGNTAITFRLSRTDATRFPAICSHCSGWAAKATAAGSGSTTTKCWLTPDYWQARALPDVVCSLISHCFDLDNVNLSGWESRRVPIADDQQNRLGEILYSASRTAQPRTLLGENFSLGARIEDCNGKCTIEISELSLTRYMRFYRTARIICRWSLLCLTSCMSSWPGIYGCGWRKNRSAGWFSARKITTNWAGGVSSGNRS